jgi:hypothetical protein
MIKTRKELSSENILKLISEYDIFKYYVSNFKSLHNSFVSDLRKDKNPTCRIFVNNQNKLTYKDFNGFSGNCFQYVKEKYSCDYNTALNIINRDFNLNLRSTWKNYIVPKKLDVPVVHKKINLEYKNTTIDIKARNYNDKDVNYWKRFYISIKTLKKYKVVPITHFWINKKLIYTDLAYSYEFYDNKRNIYQPNNKTFKWCGNTSGNIHIYGLNQVLESDLCDVLFIVSSLKEVMFLDENFGIDAIAPQSENTIIPENIICNLSEKYEKIIILFDFDKPGVINALKTFQTYKNWNNKNILFANMNINYLKFCPVGITTLWDNKKDLTDLAEINYIKTKHIIENYEQYL